MGDDSLPDARIVLDFPDAAGSSQRLCFERPESVIIARSIEEVVPALRAALAAAERGLWAVGYLAYEAAPAFDPAFAVHSTPLAEPLVWFGLFRSADTTPHDSGLESGCEAWAGDWLSDVVADEYAVRVARLQAAIARGETYQVNYTRRLTRTVPRTDDAFAFYERLRVGANYAAFLDLGERQILSASPELFFDLQGREITTRPMKGTAARGRWTDEDTERATGLLASAKERAENVMIVDLMRSDLGRIAEPGSVRIPSLFAIERYPTVFQMTSTVQSTLRAEVDLLDVFGALFPCGSVTGAPKVQTMRHIAAEETGPRGVYCGAIGVIRPGTTSAAFSVAIRTAVRDAESREVVYGVGGGITADSVAASEWQETVAKSAILHRASQPPEPPFDLLETLLLRDGEYVLLQRHLDRLADSAGYFERPCDLDATRRALQTFAESHASGDWRVRLLVDTGGNARVEGATLAPLPSGPLKVRLADTPVSRDDILLFHKTTRRAVYDRARTSMPDGVFDTLLWNREGEITEFTFGNVLVEDSSGKLWTPQRDSGLLGGTLRAELLETGEIQERRITVEEVRQFDVRLYFVNGVRGVVPVDLVS